MSTKNKEIEEKERRREASIEEALSSKDFYDISPVLAENPDISVIWGQRSNGKTYQALLYALKNYKKNKRTFVYVRRWAEDIVVKNMNKLFAPLPVEDIFGKGCYIKFQKGTFTVKRDLPEDDDDYDPEWEDLDIGWAISLNQVAHTKSQTFVGCQVVILDEFLQLKSERVLTGEFDAWEQTLSTVLRTTQDAKIFILGNSVSKYSPYFTPYGIDTNAIKQGEIKVIELPNEKCEPTRVVAQWCEFNSKIGQRTSKYVRGSKMAQTGEWEIEDVANIPHTDNEIATERLLFSMLDSVMGVNLGVFVRESKWFTLEKECDIYYSRPHIRQFLVIRQTPKVSSYYHLTNVKDLKYNTWTDLFDMFKDIEENTEIDVIKELKMGRVYCENSFVGDYFYHCYLQYSKVSIKDLL